MKKITAITIMLFSIFVSALFTSCDKEKVDYGVESDEQGELSFVGLSFSVNTEADTKADTKDYKVYIYTSGNEVVGNYTYSSLPKVIALKVGNYRIVVQSEEKMAECGDTPFYSGSQSFEIKKNKVTDLEKVVCTLTNTKVTVSVDGTLDNEIQPGFQVQVSNGGTGIYSFTEKEIKDQVVKYFNTNTHKSLTVVLIGKRPDGQIVRETSTISNVKGGEWRNIKVSVVETGALKSSLKIDSSLVEIKWDVKVPVEDDVIKPDPTPNPGDPDEPVNPDPTPGESVLTIVGNGFNIDQPQTVAIGETKTIIVNINASQGLNNLFVTIDSDKLTSSILEEVGLASNFDLANPGAYETGLKGLGFPVGSEVRGKTEIVFDITNFTPMLGIYGAGTHKFVIRAVDANNKEIEKTLTIESK